MTLPGLWCTSQPNLHEAMSLKTVLLPQIEMNIKGISTIRTEMGEGQELGRGDSTLGNESGGYSPITKSDQCSLHRQMEGSVTFTVKKYERYLVS